MNNFTKNQIKRSGASLRYKLRAYIKAALCPRFEERMWRRHVSDIQTELNEEHSGKYYTAPFIEYRLSYVQRRWPSVL